MQRRLRTVPEAAPRALGLVRQSKERDGSISPAIQITAIRDCAARRGYDLQPTPDGEEFLVGLDESGSQERSAWWKKLEQAVGWVEQGLFDVVVVWEFSRTARHRLRWAQAVDRVERAGGRIESATEQVDASTSAGRFQRGVLAEMHAYRAEAIGDGWKAAHEQRVKSGRPHSGKPKWGYVYDPEQRLHVPDRDGQGPVLADLYRRYVAGESVYQLVRWLNGHGWRTLTGGLWSDRSLRRVLDSGFAAGWFNAGGDPKRGIAPTLHQGVHEPLIEEELWQAYLDARAARRVLPPRVERSAYLLSGLVRCAKCGRSMVASWSDPGLKLNKRNGRRYSNGRATLWFRCKAGKEKGPAACVGGYVKADILEGQVLGYLRGWAGLVDEGARSKTVMSARRSLLEVEADRLAREAARVQEALVRLVVSNAEDPLPPAVFRQSREELEARAVELEAAAESAAVASRRAARDPARAAADLLERWDRLPVAGRREILRGLIDCVLVRTGRGVSRYVRVVDWDEVRG